MVDLNIKQDIFDNFCNEMAENLLDEIYRFANGNEKKATAAIWNIAEMLLMDAMRHSKHIGGNPLEQDHTASFIERMRQHRKELGFQKLG